MALNLFFAGTQCKEAEKIIEDNAYCRLYSYFNDKKCLADRFNRKANGKLFVDSGAFTAWTKGVQIDVDEYINWLNTNKEYIYLAGQVDEIPGTFRQKSTIPQVKEAAQKTFENYWYMRKRLDNPGVLVYTFHVGEPFEFLRKILTYPEVNYIALGGMVGKTLETKRAFCQKCFNIIKQSNNPDIKVHAFGMTSMSLLQEFPFTSADSTSWIMTGASGSIFSDYGILDVSQKNRNTVNSLFNVPKSALEKLRTAVEQFGYTLEELESDYKFRMCYNIKYLHAKSLQITSNNFQIKKELF